ncbi:hypothetical protein MRB53_038867 [Persea americana]|nr:hypothetical protein MRB53_038867 [Persea americana]
MRLVRLVQTLVEHSDLEAIVGHVFVGDVVVLWRSVLASCMCRAIAVLLPTMTLIGDPGTIHASTHMPNRKPEICCEIALAFNTDVEKMHCLMLDLKLIARFTI